MPPVSVLSPLGLFFLLTLSACTGEPYAPPVNHPGESVIAIHLPPPKEDTPALEETAIGLSFSGGGMRASAFSYGVLDEMHNTHIPGSDKRLTDAVDVVTGISGGSVTAAYYAWKGEETFPAFRSVFLDQDAEAGLNTNFSPFNILRVLTFGGANDNSALPVWLNQHVFHDATYGEVLAKRRPILGISASDIINRTPFVFSGATFRTLCSDLSQVKLADAVAASAAVPGAFTPINIESYADQCDWQPLVENPEATSEYYGLQTTRAAFQRYRDPTTQRYIKLLDGGLTDNFGVQGLAQVRLLQNEPYAPLQPERAIALKHALFLVVNSGRGPPKSKWSTELTPRGGLEMASMVTDTAIDANVHANYDLFRMVMMQWRDDLIKWRCGLPKAKVKAALGPGYGSWKCDEVQFYVTQISFSDTGPENASQLNEIETRFVLPPEQIDLLIDSARLALKNDATYQEFLRGLNRQAPGKI